MLKGVIFDFGNVLYRFDTYLFLRQVVEKVGGETERWIDFFQTTRVADLYERGMLTTDEFIGRIDAVSPRPQPKEFWKKTFLDIFITPIPENISLVRELHGLCHLGLLSNTNQLHFEGFIQNLDFLPLFDSLTLSYRELSLKPEEKIFRRALENIGLPAQDCLFIDDKEENILAARNLGFRSHLYRDPGEVRRLLQKEGLFLPSPA